MTAADPSLTLPLDPVVALALRKQHLEPRSRGDDLVTIIDDLVGLHATVPSSPYLQLRARLSSFAPAQLDALLDAGRAARVACMRRTLFIESAQTVPIVLAATRRLTLRDRDRFLAAGGWTPRSYERMAGRVEAALTGRALDAGQLRDAVGASASLSPVVLVMCDEGRLLRWSGTGGWHSTRPRYRRFDEALAAVARDDWPEDVAVRELVRRYVAQYGPVTETDIAWWTGLPRAAVRVALASLEQVVRVGVEGLAGEFVAHEADVRAARSTLGSPQRAIALLPVLDPCLQGYRDRARFVAPRHRHFVIDSGGNATSVILVGGRVAGVWDLVGGRVPELRLCFFDALDTHARRGVHAVADELAGDAVPVVEVDGMVALTDRSAGGFRSPLSRP